MQIYYSDDEQTNWTNSFACTEEYHVAKWNSISKEAGIQLKRFYSSCLVPKENKKHLGPIGKSSQQSLDTSAHQRR